MKIIFMKPQKAALSVIYGIFNGCKRSEWIGPKFFNIWGLPKQQKLHTCSKNEIDKICKIANENI